MKHQSPSHFNDHGDEHYAKIMAKLYEAGLSYTDLEEIVRQGPETMTYRKMNRVGRHCEETGIDHEDCLEMVNWLKFNQY